MKTCVTSVADEEDLKTLVDLLACTVRATLEDDFEAQVLAALAVDIDGLLASLARRGDT